MNEPRPTSDPEFEAHLSAVLEEMADGLSRQRVIDRLTELGFSEDEADDQEANLREQLRVIQRGTQAIVRDLENGLGRQQAVVRFQELGVSAEDAGRFVDGHRHRRATLAVETQQIVVGLSQRLNRQEGIARFQELGLSGPLAAQLVAWRCDGTAHWYGERMVLGLLAAAFGAGAIVALVMLGEAVSAAYLLPGSLCFLGLALAAQGWVKQYHLREGDSSESLFALAAQGEGRQRVVAEASARGISAGDARVLVELSCQGKARLYARLALFGLLCVGLGGYYGAWCWGQDAAFMRWCAGPVALLLWGAAGCVRGLIGWHRFSRS